MDATHPITAWADRAAELADWAAARVFVRTDRFGGYFREGDETRKSARPNKGCREPFSRDLLVRHFRAARTADVIGSYPLTPGATAPGGGWRWTSTSTARPTPPTGTSGTPSTCTGS